MKSSSSRSEKHSRCGCSKPRTGGAPRNSSRPERVWSTVSTRRSVPSDERSVWTESPKEAVSMRARSIHGRRNSSSVSSSSHPRAGATPPPGTKMLRTRAGSMRKGQSSKWRGIMALLRLKKLSQGEGRKKRTLSGQDTPQSVKNCSLSLENRCSKGVSWFRNTVVPSDHVGWARKIHKLSNSLTLALFLSYNESCTVSWESRCKLSLFKADLVSGVLKAAGIFQGKGKPARICGVSEYPTIEGSDDWI